jgi:hypothetical protein
MLFKDDSSVAEPVCSTSVVLFRSLRSMAVGLNVRVI